MTAIAAVFTIGYAANILTKTKTGSSSCRPTCSQKTAASGATASARMACPPSPKTASKTCARSSPINEPVAEPQRAAKRPNSPACGAHRMLADVLLGVNESLPSFTAFETVLSRHRPSLEIRLLTGVLHGARLAERGRRKDVIGLRQWDFDKDRTMLGEASGNLGILCRLIRPTGLSPACQQEFAIAGGDYAATLSDYPSAVQRLGPLIPAEQLDREFPGIEQAKFELLNGWQAPGGSEARSAFRRARWYLRRPHSANTLSFSVRHPHPATQSACLNVLIDGHRVLQCKLAADWLPIKIPLTAVLPSDIFVCELQLEFEPGSTPPSLDEELFQVRSRRFNSASLAGQVITDTKGRKRPFPAIPTLFGNLRDALRIRWGADRH